MLSFIILLLIVIGLVIHRYLSTYWEQGVLPYGMGFLVFANTFLLLYTVNFIWMFGGWFGIIITLLTAFQIIYASFLWPFLLPQLISMTREQSPLLLLTKSQNVNPYIYASFSFIVIGISILTLINFFVSSYASVIDGIFVYFDGDITTPLVWIVVAAVASNIIRSILLSRYL